MTDHSRRRFLQAAGLGGVAALGDFSFLTKLPPVLAQGNPAESAFVKFRPEIEPVVKLVEDTPREQLLEKVAGEIKSGLTYQEVLAALLLAGVRNVQPRPSVGFKFHAVLVVNSAHLASLDSPEEDRWLLIFWALDEFKSSQAADVREGNWTMPAVAESKLPPAHKAAELFQTAMQQWDEEAADASVATLARTVGSNQLFDTFAHFGVRDFRSIGHKAIYVANSWRTLQCIGWQHSEPVLRSLAYALLNYEGGPNPASADLAPDLPGRRNVELAKTIRPDWLDGKPDSQATTQLVNTLYSGSDEDACRAVVEMLNKGVSAQSIYDALFTAAGELLMRQPGIVGLHAVTSTNAMHYLFQNCGNDETRKLILLQNAAFLPLFRGAMGNRGRVADKHLLDLRGAGDTQNTRDDLGRIFESISSDQNAAAAQILAYLDNGGDGRDFINTARRMIFLKGNNSHDYKFSSAVLEDFYHVSPEWRNRFLATSAYNLRGSGARDNGLVQRIRAALDT